MHLQKILQLHFKASMASISSISANSFHLNPDIIIIMSLKGSGYKHTVHRSSIIKELLNPVIKT